MKNQNRKLANSTLQYIVGILYSFNKTMQLHKLKLSININKNQRNDFNYYYTIIKYGVLLISFSLILFKPYKLINCEQYYNPKTRCLHK